MEKYLQSYKNIYNFIEKYGSASNEGNNCAINISFSRYPRPDQKNINNFKTIETNQILETLTFIPIQLKNMYKIISNPNIEYYFGEWILMSLKKLKDRVDLMLQEGNLSVIDFGMRYCGMGHCVICSYDSTDGKIFFRRDGGSNGYERVDNWNFIKSYKPEYEKKHNFSIWLNKVKNEYETASNEQPWLYLQDPLLVNP